MQKFPIKQNFEKIYFNVNFCDFFFIKSEIFKEILKMEIEKILKKKIKKNMKISLKMGIFYFFFFSEENFRYISQKRKF